MTAVNSQRDKMEWPRWARWAAWGLLILGAVLRVARWGHWRALWLDEIYLAESVVSRSYRDLLLRPLEDWQVSPPGFLGTARLFVGMFGPGERALRLASLLLSLGSLPLFVAVARRMLSPRGGLFAIALMAVLGPLVYYANELKQYSGDVAATLAVVLVMLRFVEQPGVRRAVVAAAVGVLAIFFSHPAILVLAGTGLAALWQLRRGDGLALRRLCFVGLAWLFAFALMYGLFLRPAMSGDSHPHLVEYWAVRDAFMPISPRWAVPWLFQRFWAICQEPGAMWLANPDAAMIAMLVGFLAAIVSRRKGWLLVLAPLPVALAASAVRQYPFADRLTLFAVPLLILTMGAGIDFLWQRGPAMAAAIIIGAIVLYPSASRAIGHLTQPPGREESLSAYQWVARHWQAGDTLYLSYFATKSYDYYKPRSGWANDPAQSGRVRIQPRFSSGEQTVLSDIHALAGTKRVWAVFIHIDPNEEWLATAALDEIGSADPALSHFEAGADVYFYDCGR